MEKKKQIVKSVKHVLFNFSVIVATLLLVGFNYLFVFMIPNAKPMMVIQSIIIALGVTGYILSRKLVSLWIVLLGCYVAVIIYTLLLVNTRMALVIPDCDMFCIPAVFFAIGTLFILPVLSIPIFSMIASESNNSLEWRNNYKIFVILVYVVLFFSVYSSFSN